VEGWIKDIVNNDARKHGISDLTWIPEFDGPSHPTKFALEDAKGAFNIFPCALLPFLVCLLLVTDWNRYCLNKMGDLGINAVGQEPNATKGFPANLKWVMQVNFPCPAPILQHSMEWRLIPDVDVILSPCKDRIFC
jgi:hypothetical protein